MTTEGNVVHYGYIEKFNIREIAFDRWGAVQMVQNLEGMGFTVVPFGQGFTSSAVNRLVDAGILIQTSSNSRNRTFAYEAYLDILRKGT